jgi:hypothetical protein
VDAVADAAAGARPSWQAAPGYAAVIGDVVGSRRMQPGVLLRRLRTALQRTNARVTALQPLQPTLGDEFQGVYRRLGQALNATLLVRLLLHDVTDVRFGVGWGTFTRWDPDRAPFEQDGPAWWSARAALEAALAQERRTGIPAGLRTAVRLGTDGLPHERTRAAAEEAGETLVPASPYLGDPIPLDLDLELVLEGLVLFRDHVVHTLDGRDVGLVLALLEGATVTDAAARVGISQQAASRRLRANGGYGLVRSWELLERAG